MSETKSFPLCWPPGWKRTASLRRVPARFNVQRAHYGESYAGRRELTIADGVGRVLKQLQLLGIPDYMTIISTNVQVRLDGLPYSRAREPDDPGVAVYWQKRKQQKVMAIDQYDRVADNLAAIAATLDAMRAIERHGGAEILDRAFTGFVALPEPNNWRHVFGVEEGQSPDLTVITLKYRDLAKRRHPDAGGSEASMQELNAAYESAKRELNA